MLKVAYLFAPGHATIAIPTNGRTYRFSPWADVHPEDWPFLSEKGYIAGCNCHGKVQEWRPAFGTEKEIRDGLKGFSR